MPNWTWTPSAIKVNEMKHEFYLFIYLASGFVLQTNFSQNVAFYFSFRAVDKDSINQCLVWNCMGRESFKRTGVLEKKDIFHKEKWKDDSNYTRKDLGEIDDQCGEIR